MIRKILMSAMLVSASAHSYYDYDDDDAICKLMLEEQEREREEERRSKEYDTETETDDNGNSTTTVSPRSILDLLDIDMMTGAQREAIFNEIFRLKTEALMKVHRAKDLQHSILDINARACFAAILTDCAIGCSGGTPIATCILCCTELMYSKYKSTCEYWEARSLVKEAEKLYREAERLEDLLWSDYNAEDWM